MRGEASCGKDRFSIGLICTVRKQVTGAVNEEHQYTSLSIPRPDLHIGLGVLSILQSDSPLQLSRETVVGSPERKPTTHIALGRETRLRSLWKSRTVADRLSPRELALCL